ncbi:MAG: hypothetical protein LQ338_003564 [Usnochroma carphineum]|nr:MAG: hypothetical protein LQ338_003564 [Usnochroma carphineum]
MAEPHDRDARPDNERARRPHGRPRREHRERRTTRDPPQGKAIRNSEDGRHATQPLERKERREKRVARETQKRSPRHETRNPERRRRNEPTSHTSSERSSNPLNFESLAKLDAYNESTSRKTQEHEQLLAPKDKDRAHERPLKEKVASGRVLKDKSRHRRKSEYGREKRRVVSGPLAEEGRVRKRGGYIAEESGKKRFGRKCWIAVLIIVLILVILIPVGIYASKKHGGGGGSGGSSDDGADPTNDNLNGVNENDIPAAAKNTYLDPFTWYDSTDFNVTYTNETVGGLPVMGLNSNWDDSKQANENVPPLDKTWIYGTLPIRGVNLGGWLSLEPFITPSFFQSYKPNQGIIDEYTLTRELGPQKAAKTLEKHYAMFIKEDDFQQIQAAGFDHVRIPFSYWAVTTYPGDPYVPKISWRYLLRAIEYCRKYGLRVSLDLHALPGSQNGWNHSGRQGAIGWLNGTDGDLNAQRSLDIHTQLSTFFAQPRYKNIIAIYGLANEPKMIALPTSAVLDWETKAAAIVRKSGMQQYIAVGDGFLGLSKWQGQLSGVQNVMLDVHQYTIFNKNQINFPHQKKIQYACQGWTDQMKQSVNVATGFGATICGEWSQADTDCALYLNNVNTGSRWEGTLPTGDPTTSVTTPDCPPNSGTCSCDKANADPSSYSDDYKQWLMMYAEAQMASFEAGWGWFYWTWATESATQWSWKAGLAAGILPKTTWQRDFNCTSNVPDFKNLPDNY